MKAGRGMTGREAGRGMIGDLLEDGLEVTDTEEHCHSIPGMVCSPYGKQSCSGLMLLHPPGAGPQLCSPELCLISWAPSSLMDCELSS